MPPKRKRPASRKGTSGETLVQRHLESQGWHVFRARPNKAPVWRGGRVVFWVTNSNDIFSVFDGEAVHPDKPHLYWQACQPSGVRAHRRKIEAELIPYWNLALLNKAYQVEIYELRSKMFRVHEWRGGRDWAVFVVTSILL